MVGTEGYVPEVNVSDGHSERFVGGRGNPKFLAKIGRF
jgi:hypothetical protein